MDNPTFEEKRNSEVKIGESNRPNTVSEISELFQRIWGFPNDVCWKFQQF